MKVLIKKSFAGYPVGHIIEINEFDKNYYTDTVYWLRRCKDGEIDGFCELIEWNKEVVKKENVIQSNVADDKKTKKSKAKSK